MPNVLEMPVEGNVVYSYKMPDQKPLSELAPYLNDVLDDPIVHSLRWNQYTPYFNDGEPCVFGVGEMYVKLVDDDTDPEETDEQDGYLTAWNDAFKQRIGVFKWTNYQAKEYEVVGDAANPELLDAWLCLIKEFNSGCYNHALLNAYGDHARVTVDPSEDKIYIEFYDHE